MPCKCSVPGCRTNYAYARSKVGGLPPVPTSVFKFPNDPHRRDFWLSIIPGLGDGFTPTKYSRVCSKHFLAKFITRRFHKKYGLPVLFGDAYPTIFPNASNAEVSLSLNGLKSKRLLDEVHHGTKTEIDNWVSTDKITDFSSFCKEAENYLDFVGDRSKWIYELGNEQKLGSIRFSLMQQDMPVENSHNKYRNSMPLFTVTISADMHVNVQNIISGDVPENSMSWIFGNQSPPVLVYWSQFVTILCQCSIGCWINYNDFDSSVCINDLHELPPLEKEDQAIHSFVGDVDETLSIHTSEISDATIEENDEVKLKDAILQLTLKLHNAIYQRNLLMKKMKNIQDLASIDMDVVSLSLVMNSEGKEEMDKVHRLVETIMSHAEEMNAGIEILPMWMRDHSELMEKDDFLKVKFPSFQDNLPPSNDYEEMNGKHCDSNSDNYVDGPSMVEEPVSENMEVNDDSVDDSEMSMESSQPAHDDKYGEGLTCEHCQDGRRFASIKALSTHRYGMHNIKLPSQCEICGKQCKGHFPLLLHMASHSDEKPFQCAICGNTFKSKEALKKHEKTIHSEERPYTCSFCNKSFKRSDALKMHLKSHTRPYKSKIFGANKGADNLYHCNVCDKGFRKPSMLTRHLPSHSDAHPYRCTSCEKSFKFSASLSRHILSVHTHRDERPYECSLCEKKFRYRYTLKYHQLVHAEQGEFECDVCLKKFKWRKSLRNHQTRQTEEETYE